MKIINATDLPLAEGFIVTQQIDIEYSPFLFHLLWLENPTTQTKGFVITASQLGNAILVDLGATGANIPLHELWNILEACKVELTSQILRTTNHELKH